MSVSYNRKNKTRKRQILQAFPELKIAKRFIRAGKQARWFLAKLPSGGVRMRRERTPDGVRTNRRYLHAWTLHNTFYQELVLAVKRRSDRKTAVKPPKNESETT